MAVIITTGDLPADVAASPQATLWVNGANAAATRVAPCLAAPTSSGWAALTVYAKDAVVKLATGTEYLQATTAGTSGDAAPTAPALGSSVTDGTVTWLRISPTQDQIDEAKMVLVGAVSRWMESGTGAFQQQTTGPFSVSVDTRQKSAGYRLWPSEIEQLQDICGGEGSDAFSIDTVTAPTDGIWTSPYWFQVD